MNSEEKKEGVMKIEAQASKIFFMDKIEEKFPLEFEFASDIAYEVLRVMEGTPLFLQAHLDRLKVSLFSIMKIDNAYFEIWWTNRETRIKYGIEQLISENKILNQNIKILVGQDCGKEWQIIIFPIKSFYPAKEVYQSGVQTMILEEVRHQPQVKAVNLELTKRVLEIREKTGVYEALLLTPEGYIAEGSRSNLFFVKEGTLVTAPDEWVLKGITREKVIETATSLGIPIVQAKIKPEDIESYESAFLTGTSIHILPVNTIGNWHRKSASHPLMIRLMQAFEKKIQESIGGMSHGKSI